MKGAHSTNALCERYCAMMDWPYERTETRRGPIRHDLFHIADALVVKDPYEARPVPMLVQNCHYGSLRAHYVAIDKLPMAGVLMNAGFEIWLWEWKRKKAKRGGKRMAREWYLRRRQYGPWTETGPWEGPHDLYGAT